MLCAPPIKPSEKKSSYLNRLSVTYAANGEFDLAVQTAEEALALADKPAMKKLRDKITRRIEFFRSGKSWGEPEP